MKKLKLSFIWLMAGTLAAFSFQCICAPGAMCAPESPAVAQAQPSVPACHAPAAARQGQDVSGHEQGHDGARCCGHCSKADLAASGASSLKPELASAKERLSSDAAPAAVAVAQALPAVEMFSPAFQRLRTPLLPGSLHSPRGPPTAA